MKRLLFTFFAVLLLTNPASASQWHRADTHHFVIYSDGREKQLEDFAHEVERFDSLLRLLWNKPPVSEPNKLVIYLIDDADAVGDLLGPGNSNVAGFYRPRIRGSFAVGNRNTSRDRTRLSGKKVLFHEYAHHFMFQNFSVPLPAWFIEGFAEFVATAEFKRSGEWTFGRPAHHRAAEIQRYRPIPIRDLLTKKPNLNDNQSAFYGWSWALTHMLYSQKMERGKHLNRYINRIARDEDPIEAAEAVFGDLDELERSMQQYTKRSIEWNKSPNALPYQDDVTVSQLSEFDSLVLDQALKRLGRHDLETTRDELRRLTARPEATAEAFYQLAETEFSLAHKKESATRYDFSLANAATDRALELDPKHMKAHVLKGMILLEPFDHPEEISEQPDANWQLARNAFEKALAINPNHPWPNHQLADSYLREGRYSPDTSPAIALAFAQAPESNQLRFSYAIDLARQGNFPAATKILQVIANNPHSNGESARSALEKVRSMMNGGSSNTGTSQTTGDHSDEVDED